MYLPRKIVFPIARKFPLTYRQSKNIDIVMLKKLEREIYIIINYINSFSSSFNKMKFPILGIKVALLSVSLSLSLFSLCTVCDTCILSCVIFQLEIARSKWKRRGKREKRKESSAATRFYATLS